jgi:hypothetical protein
VIAAPIRIEAPNPSHNFIYMAVCLLNKDEVRKLEHHQIKPNCCHHQHASFREVKDMVRGGEMRWVGDNDRRATANRPLVWAVVNSGGYDVQQMVDQ